MFTYHIYTYLMLNDANDIWRQTSICEEYSLDHCSQHKSKRGFFNRCNSENCNIILIVFYYRFTRDLKAIQTICLCHSLFHTKRAFTLIQARVGGGLIQFISFYILYKKIFSYPRSQYFLRRRFLKGLTPLQMSYNFTLHIFRQIYPNYM